MVDLTNWLLHSSSASLPLSPPFLSLLSPLSPLLAVAADAIESATEAVTEVATEAENAPLVLAGVLVSLVVIYAAAKLGGELCARLNLPSVLGELLGGVVIGVSALHLLVFPDAAGEVHSLIINFLQTTAGLEPAAIASVFQSQSEVISVLSELGVIILLFEIGLESDLRELIRVGPQAAVVAVVG
ncbi:MAG TPA: cation:proton antiporter, partial [Chroococcidiopsis sp.]